MARLIAPETVEGKMRWQWDHYEDETNPDCSDEHDPLRKGLRKRGPQPYPAMMYRVKERNPLTFEKEVVDSAVQQHLSEQRGYFAGGQGPALEGYDKQQGEYAKLAANRAFTDRRMSAAAQAEAAAADASTGDHLPVIPETPTKRTYTRKAKAH